jgi:hypothetical protein
VFFGIEGFKIPLIIPVILEIFIFRVIFSFSYKMEHGPDSSVGIMIGYGLDGPGIESRWGARFFVHVQTGPGAHPASCTMGTGSFPGVKRPGGGADHPPPSSAEVRKE